MIDCDVHENFNNLHELLPWMDSTYRDYIFHGGYMGAFIPSVPWTPPSNFMRDDSIPADGGVPGSDYQIMREQLLDPWDVEYAILNGEEVLAVSSLPNPQLAAAIVTAYNRWLIEEWLSLDPRLKGSLVVATQDAERAAREIRTFGDHPDIVQVLLPGGSATGYGDPRYHPIYEAAVEMDLPIAMHPGGEGQGVNPPPTALGYPTYYLEWHTIGLASTAMTQVVSLISHGVFEKYPTLRWMLVESGVTWLPAVLWRMDAAWKALRSEVPWMRRSPSVTAREHIRLTTQPLDEPDSRKKLIQAFELFDGLEDMLMFAADYPHWNFDRPDLVSRRLPPEWRDKVMSENARAHYELPLRSGDTGVTERGSVA